jgi:hypothetical protein
MQIYLQKDWPRQTKHLRITFFHVIPVPSVVPLSVRQNDTHCERK